MSESNSMGKRVVVVSGGAAGIGWEAAVKFVQSGWFAVIADRDIEAARSRALAYPNQMDCVNLDVTSSAAVQSVFDELYSRHGRLTALVNSAGIQKLTWLQDFDWAALEAVMAVNFVGTLRCMQAVGSRMAVDGGGAIVNLSSISPERGPVGRVPYAASKAAVVAATRSAAAEWAAAGVRVNAVAPGYVATPLVEEHLRSGQLQLDSILSRIPMRRLARPREIANTIHFLCSDDSSYITGQVIVADGGYLVDYGIAAQDSGESR